VTTYDHLVLHLQGAAEHMNTRTRIHRKRVTPMLDRVKVGFDGLWSPDKGKTMMRSSLDTTIEAERHGRGLARGFLHDFADSLLEHKREEFEEKSIYSDLEATGTRCSKCGELQLKSPHGDVCKNGHGGAPPMEMPDAE
jgi:hypothetical protein